MRILVFGQTGQVATELRRQSDVTTLSRAEADLRYPDACAAQISAHRPEAVINAAAWTGVDAAEDHEAEAHLINAEAPKAMARACAEQNCPFLHISSDYVFDGSGTRPWRETDPPAPQNSYGRTKLAGEEAVRETGSNHVILRTSWVFSAHGANFVKTMLRLSESHDQLSVVSDQIGCPTPAADIAAALLQIATALKNGQDGGTYHFGGQPPVSWSDFARAIFACKGRATNVTDIPTDQYPTPAARPLNSRLDCAKLTADFGIKPPDWNAGLARVIDELDRP